MQNGLFLWHVGPSGCLSEDTLEVFYRFGLIFIMSCGCGLKTWSSHAGELFGGNWFFCEGDLLNQVSFERVGGADAGASVLFLFSFNCICCMVELICRE